MEPLIGSRAALHRFVIASVGATLAEHFVVPQNLAVEVDAFAAGGADYAVGFVSGEFFGGEFDFYPLLGE